MTFLLQFRRMVFLMISRKGICSTDIKVQFVRTGISKQFKQLAKTVKLWPGQSNITNERTNENILN